MSREHQLQIRKFFEINPILYIAGLGIVFRSPHAGILLSQLLYWHGLGSRSDGFIYITEKQLYMETGLTRTMERTARKILLKFELIDYKRAGIPAKKCYRVNFVNVQKLLPSLKKTYKLHYPNPPIVYDENLQPITKSTAKTSSNNSAERLLSNESNGARSAGIKFTNKKEGISHVSEIMDNLDWLDAFKDEKENGS